MRKMWLVAVAAAVLVSGAVCNRNDKTEQAAALESAYQSGIITKGEYDTKKAELVGAAAAATTTVPVAPATPAAVAPVPPAAPAPAAVNPAPAVPPSPAAAPAQVTPSAPGGGTSASGLVAAGRSTVEHTATRVIAEPKAALRAATPDQPAPLAGCEDAPQSGKENGTEERFFAIPEARVKEAAASALQSLDFTIRKNSRNTLEANKKLRVGPIAGPGGEKVTLEFRETERDGQQGTLVTGETKKNFVLRVGQKSWTDAVLVQTACILIKGTAPP